MRAAPPGAFGAQDDPDGQGAVVRVHHHLFYQAGADVAQPDAPLEARDGDGQEKFTENAEFRDQPLEADVHLVHGIAPERLHGAQGALILPVPAYALAHDVIRHDFDEPLAHQVGEPQFVRQGLHARVGVGRYPAPPLPQRPPDSLIRINLGAHSP